MLRVALALGLGGCGLVFGLEEPRSAIGDAATDDGVGSDGMGEDVANDTPTGVGLWGTPELAFPSNDADDDPTLTADMRLMFFDRGGDVWVTSRNATSDPWDTPMKVNELSTTDVETTPEVNDNGLFITVASNRPNSQGMDIWWSLRQSVSDVWPGMIRLANVNSTSGEASGNMTADTLTYVFSSDRPGGPGSYDLYMATRQDDGIGTTFDPPTRIDDLATDGADVSPFIVGDGSEIYFDVGGDLYHATRNGNGWNTPEPITELNTMEEEGDPWVSADGHHLYFARAMRIYHVTR